jgi:hypothetical protein
MLSPDKVHVAAAAAGDKVALRLLREGEVAGRESEGEEIADAGSDGRPAAVPVL